MRRGIALLAVVMTVAGCAIASPSQRAPVVAGTGPRQPLMFGWEQHLSVTWEVEQRGDRSLVSGYVYNRSPYDLAHVRVLVDGLDANGQIVEQWIRNIPGELRGGGRLYFDVPIAPAATVRVRVFSYDRLESAGLVG